MARRPTLPFEPLEPRRLLAAGDLDMTFGGGDGVATLSTQPGSQIDRGQFVAVDPQGRLVVLGTTAANRNAGTASSFLLARFTEDGAPDPTFGGGAGFVTRASLTTVATPRDLAVQPDGKILVACRGLSAEWRVMRFNVDGTPDNTFSGDGVAEFDFGTETITRLALQPDGRIVTVGNLWDGPGAQKAAVVRLLPNGSLDSSFGVGGVTRVEFNVGGANEFYDVALDGDRIVAVGRTRNAAAGQPDVVGVARLLPSGALDTSFNYSGMAYLFDVFAYTVPHSVAVDAASRVVVAALTSNSATYASTPLPLNLYRLTADGQRDGTFNPSSAAPGRPNRLTLPEVTLYAADPGELLVQPDGKLLFGGAYSDATSNAFQVVRATADGLRDVTFGGGDGVVKFTPTAPRPSVGTDLALDPQRRIVMSGLDVPNGTSDFDLAVARLDSGMAPPVGVGTDGVLRIRGDAGPDVVLVRRAADDLLVTLNGATTALPATAVVSVDVELYAGDDTVTFDGGVPGGRIDLGGGAANQVNVNPGNLAGGPRLEVYGGEGVDTVTVAADAGPAVFFDGGTDTAHDYLVLGGTPADDLFHVAGSTIDRGGVRVAEHARVSTITLDAGAGADTFDATAATRYVTYNLNGGDGDDTFSLTDGAGDTLAGTINVTGGAGDDALTYDDSAGGWAQQPALIRQTWASFNGSTVNFSAETLRFIAGADGRSVDLRPSAATRMILDARGVPTYPGQDLKLDPTAATVSGITRTSPRDGVITFADAQPVEYRDFETIHSAWDTTRPTGTGTFDVNAGQVIRFTFSEDVSLTVDPSDLELRNLTTGQIFSVKNGLTLELSGGVDLPTVATWRMAAGLTLPDGNYRATLRSYQVRDYADNAMATDVTVDFSLLAGDANRDRTVNFTDLLALAKNYNQSARTWSDGDFTGDGIVNFADLLILAKAYNKTLPAPAPAVAASASVTPATATTVFRDETSTKPVFSTARVSPPTTPKPAPAKPKPVARPKSR